MPTARALLLDANPCALRRNMISEVGRTCGRASPSRCPTLHPRSANQRAPPREKPGRQDDSEWTWSPWPGRIRHPPERGHVTPTCTSLSQITMTPPVTHAARPNLSRKQTAPPRSNQLSYKDEPGNQRHRTYPPHLTCNYFLPPPDPLLRSAHS
jgi:hypothetical protein